MGTRKTLKMMIYWEEKYTKADEIRVLKCMYAVSKLQKI
jgi:hypothetical protein